MTQSQHNTTILILRGHDYVIKLTQTNSRTENKRIRAAYQLPEAKQLRRRNRQKEIREKIKQRNSRDEKRIKTYELRFTRSS